MKNPDDIIWLLLRIDFISKNTKWPVTQRVIFMGSYDVWSCEQDRIDAVVIPKRRMAEAKEKGLIVDFPNPKNEKWERHWKLTEAGEKYLIEHPDF